MVRANDELLKAIGKFFLTFATIEAILSLQLARLISHPAKFDNPTALALSGTKISVLLKQIQIMAYYKVKQPHRDKIIEKCDKIRDCFDLRNSLAHCASGSGPDGDKLVVRPLKMLSNKRLARAKTLHTKQINEATKKILNHCVDLETLLDEVGIDKSPKYDEPKS